jgi:SAM-dependent methyltransferase
VRDTAIEVRHYTGEAGRRYFAYQSQFGELAGRIVARKLATHIRPSDVVLDFGCGDGSVLKSLTCRQRLGVDVNSVARQAAERNGIICFDTLDGIGPTSVDVAISHHSLEHVPSPLLTLREIQSKLKPGGRLLIVVPIDDWRVQRAYDPTDINHHLYTWTPNLLGHLLYEAGFDTKTLSTRIGINGWCRIFPLWYGKVPRLCLSLLLRAWCVVRKTREIYGVVHKPL